MQQHSFLPIFYTNTHRSMQRFNIYSNASRMRLNTQKTSLHMDSPTPNKVKGQCLFYKYTQSQIMESPKQILKSIVSQWNLWVNAWGWLGLSSSQQAVREVWACKILALALAYHPLVDLTPFSVATAGGAVRKLEKGSGGKESARKNIQLCFT